MNIFKRLFLLPLILMATIAWAVNQDQPTPSVISAKEALGQVGKSTVRVEMTVKQAKDRLERRGIIYLDSEEDFTHADNLGIAISVSASDEFKKQGIADPAAYLKGKKIQVDGCIMRFEERPYLPVLEAKQIRVTDGQ